MEELALSCFGVSIHLVDDADTGLCEQLQASFPREFVVPQRLEAAVVSYVVAVDAEAGTDQRPLYSVTRDGIEVFAPASDEEVFQWLWHDIDMMVAARAREMLFVHAGVVGWRGLAIVIPGGGGTGKSMLVAELVRRGAMYYSDVFAVLDDEGKVHPYARPPLLGTEREQPNDLRLERGDMPREPLPIGLVVSGGYGRATGWRPAVVRGSRATWPLTDNAVLARQEAAKTMRVAGQLAPSIVTLQGAWPNATDAAGHILDLVDDALMSHATGADDSPPSMLTSDLAGVAEVRFQSQIGRPRPAARRLIAARFVRITDLLAPAEHRRMLEQALACEADFKELGVIDPDGEHALDRSFRRSRTLLGPGLEEVWALLDRRLRPILPAVRKQLGMPWFPLGDVERQLTAHGGGGFFAPHVDDGHPTVANRRISCVYYFFTSPQRFTGGELKLYDTWDSQYGTTGAPTYTELAPVDNSVVFFPSNQFHEVCPVQLETDAFENCRFTVTIWFRETKESVPITELGTPA